VGVELAAWMALAYRSALPTAERLRAADDGGIEFPDDVIAREEADLAALSDLGVRVLTVRDDEYPARLRGDDGPLVLQVAGRAALLEDEGVEVVAGYRGREGQRLMELLDAGGRAVVVMNKGLLRAQSLLRALHEPLENGSVALVSAEPPRASWGPLRDRNRDALAARLAPGA
jgi:predicted Rossmann fold nucleotide-binding protein DprA/Smf involved in DNA uptake